MEAATTDAALPALGGIVHPATAVPDQRDPIASALVHPARTIGSRAGAAPTLFGASDPGSV